jgi:hypothetical protein
VTEALTTNYERRALYINDHMEIHEAGQCVFKGGLNSLPSEAAGGIWHLITLNHSTS